MVFLNFYKKDCKKVNIVSLTSFVVGQKAQINICVGVYDKVTILNYGIRSGYNIIYSLDIPNFFPSPVQAKADGVLLAELVLSFITFASCLTYRIKTKACKQ